MQGGERVRGLDTSGKPRSEGAGPSGQQEPTELSTREARSRGVCLRNVKSRGLYLREARVEGINHHRETRTEKVEHQGSRD